MTAIAQLAEFEARLGSVNYTRWSKADLALHNDLLHKARAERWREQFGPGPDEPLPLDAEMRQFHNNKPTTTRNNQ